LIGLLGIDLDDGKSGILLYPLDGKRVSAEFHGLIGSGYP
jgi:hypothetical protein